MLYWLFDLDYTLYQLPKDKAFRYTLLQKDRQLEYLINELPSKKIIFTNGTNGHAIQCINKMGIENCFHNIVGRDDILQMKPNTLAFHRFNNINNISSQDKCVFFEDNVDNLVEAKNLGWITVLISPTQYVHPYIDFCFPNIHIALNYFNTQIQNYMNKNNAYKSYRNNTTRNKTTRNNTTRNNTTRNNTTRTKRSRSTKNQNI